MAEEKKKKPQKRATLDKWKRKKWFKIVAPDEFNKKELGETIVEKPKNLEGRTIRTNLGELTGQRQKRHIKVEFQVDKVEGAQAQTRVVGHEISTGFIMRMTRRRTSKMEVVQIIETSDDQKIRVKTVALSARKLAVNQETDIRNLIKTSIEKSCSKKSHGQLMQEIIFGSLASKLFKQVKKIAPIKRLEIVKSQLV
ncbi:MAG: 30S ribosomal protein S3ae [Candidatus Diapherotrites archaeon]|nr:30S ribosomal protein S3ae [Candidatus Diapherotrites archaeon]